MELNVMRNQEHKGIEIYFDGKPESNVLNALKENGFRWHNMKKCWYAKETDKTNNLIQLLNNGDEIQIATVEPKTSKATTRTRKEILSFYGYEENNEGYMGGHLIQGSKHNVNLTPRQIANQIKKDFNELHPNLKVSISYNSYSMGSSRTATLIGEIEQLFKPIQEYDFSKYYYDFVFNGEQYSSRYNYMKTLDDLPEAEQAKIKELFYNHLTSETHQQVHASENYTEEANQAITDLWQMLKCFASVESNMQVDYFHGFDTPSVYLSSTEARRRSEQLHALKWREYSKLYPSFDKQLQELENN